MSSDPQTVFADLHRTIDAAVGARLFTVTVLDRKAKLARRAYTSHPAEYPTSGVKPMLVDGWSEKVIDRGETFIANTTDGFSPYFPDHPLINSLGCHSAMNLPVIEEGEVIGTVNLLDIEQHFTPERVERIRSLVEENKPALVRAMRDTPMTA
ncbi:GAF domain-containing protein [Gellertiella hungarica]|uniref:Transcriptional regulator with GAF, ATPase, and Fis domain n=1 Tax=Gellertiella hungarica TaxID=1572859 RepID=A0A7W6J7K7_9HYPH|nr:GAF domain-containing protein [Gellertiella hungarica]MBB4066207.1 transcriptional regulator with GAF, ATPase, and Fis domain [Gellertiella hungarica]